MMKIKRLNINMKIQNQQEKNLTTQKMHLDDATKCKYLSR